MIYRFVYYSVKIFLGKIFYQNNLSCLRLLYQCGILKTTRVHVSGKANRAEGLLRLWDTDTPLITFREK
jgi:hypothetical protein